MLADYLIAPSMNSLLVTGILIMIIVILFFSNINQILKENYYKKLILLSSLCLSFGMHGMLHLGLEKQYGFNPYTWF
jgi:uncharacterized membrane protein